MTGISAIYFFPFLACFLAADFRLTCFTRGGLACSMREPDGRGAIRLRITSSLASRSSSRISMFVMRSAMEMTSARDGMASCSSVLSMAFSTASRNGAEMVR